MPVLHQIYSTRLVGAIFFCNMYTATNPGTIENDMNEGTERPKKRGRPALPPEKGKRHAIGIRTTKELRDLLQRGADLSGRSLAQEIEFRLERSFDREKNLTETMIEVFGDARTLEIFKEMAIIARDPSRRYHWTEDFREVENVIERWAEFLVMICPVAPTGQAPRVLLKLRDLAAMPREELHTALESQYRWVLQGMRLVEFGRY